MTATHRARRLAPALAAALALAIALPALAQEASPPGRGPKPKASKEPGTPVTLTGRVATATDADGGTIYTLTVGGERLVLSAGPAWWYGAAHPLASSVGKTVTIAGERKAGSDEVSVETIGGERIREPGRPPWAGGWKVVGEKHPGWSPEKAARVADRLARFAARASAWAARWADGHPGLGKGPKQPEASSAP